MYDHDRDDDGDGICSTEDTDGVAQQYLVEMPVQKVQQVKSSSCEEFIYFVHANGTTYLESNVSKKETDNDADGCQDSSKDTDDDNDGVLDTSDNCQNSDNADQRIQIRMNTGIAVTMI